MNLNKKDIDDKFKVLQIYNQKRDKFGGQMNENIKMKTVADIMLDCLDFKSERLINNPIYWIQDFNNAKNLYDIY